jgi:hypothetical protein
VYGEKAGQPINLDSFWGIVTGVINSDQGTYEITDDNEGKHRINRPDLRLRRRHTRAFGHVSDDKVHDRHAMQHFTKQELEELEKYMKQYFPDDIPHGRIVRLHQHSDNASQHFKSTGALHFFTCLTTRITTLAAYVYSFGAPGHGKGPWDGVGGRWKSKVDQCSSSSETQGRLSYTDSGYIQSVKDVFMALQYHFERGEQRDMQLAGKNPIHGYQFFMYTHDHNPIQRPTESFKTLEGISSHYQFVVKGEGHLYMRLRSCWCLPCMKELMDGALGWSNARYAVPGCDSMQSGTDATAESPSVYSFSRRECTKTSGPGVVRQVQRNRRNRNDLAAQLAVGEWALFAAPNDDDDQQIWLGRIMSNPEWGGQGTRQNTTRRQHSYNGGMRVGPREAAMNIIWYESIGAGVGALEYHLSRVDTTPVIQNSRTFIPLHFEMHQVIGRVNPVPKLRISTRPSGQDNASYQTTFERWHDREFGMRWKMDEEVRITALALSLE